MVVLMIVHSLMLKKWLTAKTINGNALRAGVDAGYSLEEHVRRFLDAKFINNASNFRNELAQSPDFVGRADHGPGDMIPSTPRSTSRLLCIQRSTPCINRYLNLLRRRPAAKLRTGGLRRAVLKEFLYQHGVYTAELSKMKYAYLSSKVPRSFATARHAFGPATPNRTGISGALNLGFLHDPRAGQGRFCIA